MARGRPRKPHRLRVLEGGRGHSRPLTPDLSAPSAPLVAPRGLSRDELAAWRDHAGWVAQMGLQSPVDSGQFLGMIRQYCRALKADRAIAKTKGLTVESRANGKVALPEFAISERAWAHYERLASKFGLDPQARAKLTGPQTPKECAGDVPAELRDAGGGGD